MADGVQEVGLAQAGIAVNEKGIIGIARRLAYGDAACVCQPIAGADDEIVKGIIGMKGRLVFLLLARQAGLSVAVGGELDRYEVSGDLLGGTGKGVSAVALQELGAGMVGTADFERAAGEVNYAKIVEPPAGVDGVEGLCTVQYIREDIFNFTAGQVILLYSR